MSLALKIFALSAAKNHFVFLFFVILKKRKWFLLRFVFIESFELLSPAFAKPFPVGGNATKSDHLTKVEEINQILKIYHSEY